MTNGSDATGLGFPPADTAMALMVWLAVTESWVVNVGLAGVAGVPSTV